MSIASVDERLESMISATRRMTGPVLVVELSWAKRKRVEREIELSVVLDAPGHADSRFRVEPVASLPASSPDERATIVELARRLAERLGARLYPEGGELEADGERWLARQGPSPQRPWRFAWHTIRWLADGSEVHASGERSVLAESGTAATAAVEKAVARPLMPPYRYRVASAELGQGVEHACSRAYPPSLPSADELRGWALAGQAPSQIVLALAARPGQGSLVLRAEDDGGSDGEALVVEAEVDTITQLDRMVALELAFSIDLRALSPVSSFLAGRLGAAALDEALSPLLERARPQWSLPLLLQQAHAEGLSIAPLLRACRDQHGLSLVQLARALREAFNTPLLAVKSMLDSLAEPDEHVDALLSSALEARRASEPRPDRLSLN